MRYVVETLRASNGSRFPDHDWRANDWRRWNRFVIQFVGAVLTLAVVPVAAGVIG